MAPRNFDFKIDTDLIPNVCQWYRKTDSESRAAFREHISDMFCTFIRLEGAWQRYEVENLWSMTALKTIADEDHGPDTFHVLKHIWNYAVRLHIDPVPLFRLLAENLDPNQRAGVLVNQMLQSR